MFQRKPSRFRRRPNNGRNYRPHGTSMSANRTGSNAFSNGQPRNNFRSTLSPEKSFEKYSLLAKEAMSSGDKTLGENYLQHADHYMRVIEDRNKSRNQNKVQNEDNKNLTNSDPTNQNKEITN
mgnify:CR=1 FL=1